jgi:hypothetical protein
MSGNSIKMKMNMRVPQLQLAGDGGARILLAQSDTYRIRLLSPDGKTTGTLTRAVARHRYSSAELARFKQRVDSTMDASMKAGAAAAGGRGIPRPEIEYILPEYAPALGGMIAGDRFVLVSRSIDFDQTRQADWDVLGYDGKLLGTLRLPPAFTPRSLRGDRLFGIEKDELDIESIAVYKIAPR